MATYTDDFNRADESPLTAPWVALAGLDLVSNQVVRTGGTKFVRLDDNYTSDQSSTVTLIFTARSGYVGPAVRMNALEGCYYVYYDVNGDDAYVRRKDDKGIQSNVFAPSNIGLVSGDSLTLAIAGNVLTLFLNGIEIGQGTDAENTQTTGSAGFYLDSSTTAVEDFTAEGQTAADTIPPIITLTGYSRSNVALNGTYVDDGATATDNVDSSVTVVASDDIDLSTVGEYTVTYNASDLAGNPAKPLTRSVVVVDSATTFLDDFNRADEVELSYPWANCLTNGVSLINGKASVSANETDFLSFVAGESFSPDQRATVVIAEAPSFSESGPAVRCDENGNGYVAAYFVSQDRIRLFKFVNGVRSQLVETGSSAIRAGSYLSLEVIGNTLNVYTDGSLFTTFTDTIDPITTGSVGLHIKSSSSGTNVLDNFLAEGLLQQKRIENIDTDNTVTDGQQTVPLTVSGFAGDISGVNLKVGADTLALTGLTGTGTSYTFDMNDITTYTVDTLGLPLSSVAYQNQIEVTDGTDTATINITREPKAGYAVVETVSAVATQGSIFETRTGGAPFDGSQIYYPTASNTSISPTGVITTDSTGFTAFVWDVTSKNWEVATFDTADTIAPIITLTGAASVTITQGDTYTDAGASTDDGSTVTTSGTVNTSVLGTYTITYNSTDAAGNAATPVTRTVIVEAATVVEPETTITVSGIPDGTHNLFLVNQSTGLIAFNGDATFTGGSTSVVLNAASGVTLKGYVDDGSTANPIGGRILKVV